MNPKFWAKCTTCQKTEQLTQAQIDEAKSVGVAFSSCCRAVMTIEKVEAILVRKKRP